jgi:hypothetical protein
MFIIRYKTYENNTIGYISYNSETSDIGITSYIEKAFIYDLKYEETLLLANSYKKLRNYPFYAEILDTTKPEIKRLLKIKKLCKHF